MAVLLLAVPAVAQAQTVTKNTASAEAAATAPSYIIGAGDELRIFVWKNPDLSTDVPVRPDGKISTPLVPDIQAQGRTPTELAAGLRVELSKYIQDPVVTVLVKTFAAPSSVSAIRVIGAAVTPKAVPYHAGLTTLDVLIEVGGLNTFADGNDAILIRNDGGKARTYELRLADLLRNGEMSANMKLMPGDVIRIPERWF
ncbi:MAG TPA: XrtA/PEP-CTERM system exopolysaccharide export protein [Rhizomicrobium sp.]|jgi:polysaccharide export outer membrane protein